MAVLSSVPGFPNVGACLYKESQAATVWQSANRLFFAAYCAGGYRLTESDKNHFVLTLTLIKYHPVSHIYVQTYYGTQDGWQPVGGRRTASDAERFCALLSRIRSNRISKVQAVPVHFVLGEWCFLFITRPGQPYRVNLSHLSHQPGAVHPVPFLYLNSDHVKLSNRNRQSSRGNNL